LSDFAKMSYILATILATIRHAFIFHRAVLNLDSARNLKLAIALVDKRWRAVVPSYVSAKTKKSGENK